MTLILKTFYNSVSCLVLITATLLALPWRFVVYIVAKVVRPELQSFVSGTTRAFCSTGSWGAVLPTNTLTVLTVEGTMDLETFKNLFIKRVLKKRDQNGYRIYGKFYQTITYFLGYPFWMREKNFDLTNHIELYDYREEGIKSFDENCLKTYLSNLMNKPWDSERSYWHISLVHDFNGKDQTLIILKWQHALCDGFSMKSILKAVCYGDEILKDSTTNGKSSTSFQFQKSYFDLFFHHYVLFSKKLKSIILFPYEAASFKEQVAGSEIKLWEQDAAAKDLECYLGFTKPFEVNAIKSVQAQFSVGFQTVLFSAVSSALEKALKVYEPLKTKILLADYSKPKTPHPEGMTNSFYFGHIFAPLVANSNTDRLLQSEKSFQAHRDSNLSLGVDCIVAMATLLPGNLPWIFMKFIIQFIHIIFTSFPYFGELKMDGLAVTDLLTVFATPHYSGGFAVIVTGTANRVRFGLTMRKNIRSLPPQIIDTICRYIEEELENLFKLSSSNH